MGLGDLSPGAQLTIGVSVGVLSTSIQSLGLTLQRKSHLLEDELPHTHKRPPHRRRRWQIGILLFIVSNILGSSIQITTLPLVILSPLQASGLVFNSICATLILAEPFTRYSLVGTLLVCVGAALIAAFGAMKEPAHSLDELLELLGTHGFVLWISATALMVVAILGGVKAWAVMRPRTRSAPRVLLLRGIAYGCVSGILSAHCLLLAKSAVELLIRTIVDRSNQFNRWQSWMIIIGLVTLALTQLYYLHRGLKLCSTSVLYPLVFCVYNIIAILDGLIYYQQASRLSVLHGCFIALGTVILLSGVFALSWRLEEETATTAGSALSPGVGFVDTDDEEEGEIDDTLASPRFLRRRTMSQADQIWGELLDEEAAEAVDERSGLLQRSVSSPGVRRKWGRERRGSYMFPRVGGSARRAKRSQDAMGGWWKLGWWKGTGEEDAAAAGAEGRRVSVETLGNYGGTGMGNREVIVVDGEVSR
ncbi:uncharacterized protein H6S33_002777 [Morchella sextelata]|uniref:uncharacterized protein n=1 Tax=Morchella sextelata TaxID=1174677 RepID=UPI001D03F03D|nr:uncharacterized protein H6S33_002777 [Morchella sextelata]KAH0607743.1 hypothetical protein H6S33_002777 [Morchella sextelata]